MSGNAFDRARIYRMMLRSRLFEEAVAKLWEEGLISGEMHLGTGEEAIVAAVLDQLTLDDALALDHRGTSASVMRNVELGLLLREFLGKPGGLCRGMGGHMHLFSREHRLASSGIVGASGPAALGFALAGKRRRQSSISVAFFGDAAMNQGMLMEAINLASAWRLPVLFVCKDDSWGITTRSEDTTGGTLSTRAEGLGATYVFTRGHDAEAVWTAANEAVARLRDGGPPVFLHASCTHMEGHFLGFQLLKAARNPLSEAPALAAPLVRSVARGRGAPIKDRVSALRSVTRTLFQARRHSTSADEHDPIPFARKGLLHDPEMLEQLEREVEQELSMCMASVIREDST